MSWNYDEVNKKDYINKSLPEQLEILKKYYPIGEVFKLHILTNNREVSTNLVIINGYNLSNPAYYYFVNVDNYKNKNSVKLIKSDNYILQTDIDINPWALRPTKRYLNLKELNI